jgi:hypothetical protein
LFSYLVFETTGCDRKNSPILAILPVIIEELSLPHPVLTGLNFD